MNTADDVSEMFILLLFSHRKKEALGKKLVLSEYVFWPSRYRKMGHSLPVILHPGCNSLAQRMAPKGIHHQIYFKSDGSRRQVKRHSWGYVDHGSGSNLKVE